jgi:hypothetical protein
VILNGARLAEGTGTYKLLLTTFQSLWDATVLAFNTGKKQFAKTNN